MHVIKASRSEESAPPVSNVVKISPAMDSKPREISSSLALLAAVAVVTAPPPAVPSSFTLLSESRK